MIVQNGKWRSVTAYQWTVPLHTSKHSTVYCARLVINDCIPVTHVYDVKAFAIT